MADIASRLFSFLFWLRGKGESGESSSDRGIVESVCCVPFQDSSKTSRKVSDKWVQTRGYQACVVYMPIPLRVCLAGAPTYH